MPFAGTSTTTPIVSPSARILSSYPPGMPFGPSAIGSHRAYTVSIPIAFAARRVGAAGRVSDVDSETCTRENADHSDQPCSLNARARNSYGGVSSGFTR